MSKAIRLGVSLQTHAFLLLGISFLGLLRVAAFECCPQQVQGCGQRLWEAEGFQRPAGLKLAMHWCRYQQCFRFCFADTEKTVDVKQVDQKVQNGATITVFLGPLGNPTVADQNNDKKKVEIRGAGFSVIVQSDCTPIKFIQYKKITTTATKPGQESEPIPSQSTKGWEVDKAPGDDKDEYGGMPVPGGIPDNGGASDLPVIPQEPGKAPPELNEAQLKGLPVGSVIIMKGEFRMYIVCDCKILGVVEWSMKHTWTVEEVTKDGKKVAILSGPASSENPGTKISDVADVDPDQGKEALKKLGCK